MQIIKESKDGQDVEFQITASCCSDFPRDLWEKFINTEFPAVHANGLENKHCNYS